MICCPSCARLSANDCDVCPRCGANLSALTHDPLENTAIGNAFRVEALIGAGAMGKVYRGLQLSLGKQIAIKILHPHLLGDPSLKARFQREARASSRLNHPNCIQVLDFGESESGDLYIAMEYLDGKDLADTIADEFPLPFERLHRILSQVCSALDEAHEQGIIHRDLKPENIMLVQRRNEPDLVKVLDFGIAKIQTPSGPSEHTVTRGGNVCGTPEYMSPEQARADELDARSDVYALGATMFFLFTGTLPYIGDSPLAIVTQHLCDPVPDPRAANPAIFVPDAVAELIVSAMAKDRQDRPDSAAALRDALTEALAPALAQNLLPAPADYPRGLHPHVEPPPVVASISSGPSSRVIVDVAGDDIDDHDAFAAEATAMVQADAFADLPDLDWDEPDDDAFGSEPTTVGSLLADLTDEAPLLAPTLDTFPSEPTAIQTEPPRSSAACAFEPTAPIVLEDYAGLARSPDRPSSSSAQIAARALAKASGDLLFDDSAEDDEAFQGERTAIGLSPMAQDVPADPFAGRVDPAVTAEDPDDQPLQHRARPAPPSGAFVAPGPASGAFLPPGAQPQPAPAGLSRGVLIALVLALLMMFLVVVALAVIALAPRS